MIFEYVAYDSSGKQVEDRIEARSEVEATEALRRQGLYILKIDASVKASATKRQSTRVKARLKHLSIFTRQLAVLVQTGTPMVQALTSLEHQAGEPGWQAAIARLRERLEEGKSLSEAMAEQPERFDAVCRSLIAAGESSGSMDKMLNRLAQLTRQQQHVQSSVIGALVYPALLIVVAISVLGLMLGFVLPRFTGLFETMDMPLPPTTKMLMLLSEFARAYWWAVVGGLVGIGVGLTYWSKTDKGVEAMHTCAIKAPQLRKITRAFATARITRLLGVLINSSVPVLDSLELTLEATQNIHYRRLLAKSVDGVTRGEDLSATLHGSGLIDAAVVEAIHSGESGGQLGTVLQSLSDYLDEQNEVVLRSLTSILEPVILLVLGGLVAFVAVSMFLPLFDLTAMTGK